MHSFFDVTFTYTTLGDDCGQNIKQTTINILRNEKSKYYLARELYRLMTSGNPQHQRPAAMDHNTRMTTKPKLKLQIGILNPI